MMASCIKRNVELLVRKDLELISQVKNASPVLVTVKPVMINSASLVIQTFTSLRTLLTVFNVSVLI